MASQGKSTQQLTLGVSYPGADDSGLGGYSTQAGQDPNDNVLVNPFATQQGQAGGARSVGGSQDQLIKQRCKICGDTATGKHYGADSCDGCKGFFRRSIRKNTKYTCRYNRKCMMTKDLRNRCRFCRLKMCYQAGMYSKLVQTERDKITPRKSPHEETTEGILVSLQIAQEAESQGLKSSIDQPIKVSQTLIANTDDVIDAIKQQLRQLINWANRLPCFATLNSEDKSLLITSRACDLLILGAVRRTCYSNLTDSLLLVNNRIVTQKSPGMEEVATIIIKQMLDSIRRVNLDDKEFAGLKAVVLLNPYAPSLSRSGFVQLDKARHHLNKELMHYMNDKQYDPDGRYSDLMMTLPSLREASLLMAQKVNLAETVKEMTADQTIVENLNANASRSYSSLISGSHSRRPMSAHHNDCASTSYSIPDNHHLPSAHQLMPMQMPNEFMNPGNIASDASLQAITLNNQLYFEHPHEASHHMYAPTANPHDADAIKLETSYPPYFYSPIPGNLMMPDQGLSQQFMMTHSLPNAVIPPPISRTMTNLDVPGYSQFSLFSDAIYGHPDQQFVPKQFSPCPSQNSGT